MYIYIYTFNNFKNYYLIQKRETFLNSDHVTKANEHVEIEKKLGIGKLKWAQL